MERFGYKSKRTFSILHRNVKSWRAFLLICDQIIYSEGLPMRFDYLSIDRLLVWYQVEMTSELIEKLRLCEGELLKKMRGG